MLSTRSSVSVTMNANDAGANNADATDDANANGDNADDADANNADTADDANTNANADKDDNVGTLEGGYVRNVPLPRVQKERALVP